MGGARDVFIVQLTINKGAFSKVLGIHGSQPSPDSVHAYSEVCPDKEFIIVPRGIDKKQIVPQSMRHPEWQRAGVAERTQG